MAKFVYFDEETRQIIAFYDDELHTAIPEPCAEISDAQWLDAINTNANTFENEQLIYVESTLSVSEQNERALNARKSAQRNESDPLFMEWKYDLTAESEQIWRDKVNEIKLRYPLTE